MVSSIFNITHQDNLDKHLGCPVFQCRQKTETFLELVNITTEKLQIWKTRHISKAGRVALIQANVESMPAHTLQCFQLPRDTNQQIDKISRDLFSKKSNKNKGLPTISWYKICRPNKAGGLGLRKMEAVNSASVSKLTWKLFYNQGLWVEQMQAKYQLDEVFFVIKPKKMDSWVWKCILKDQQQFRKGVR